MLVTNVPMKNQPKIRPILRVSNVVPLRLCGRATPYAREASLEQTRTEGPEKRVSGWTAKLLTIAKWLCTLAK